MASADWLNRNSSFAECKLYTKSTKLQTSSVLIAHIRKSPDIAQTHTPSNASKNIVHFRTPSVTFWSVILDCGVYFLHFKRLVDVSLPNACIHETVYVFPDVSTRALAHWNFVFYNFVLKASRCLKKKRILRIQFCF